ncbi:hypothetical protein FMM05_17245 [Flavobacterium zepuense]|uniref:Uncharacterized protein n=1 Tax=Flavobacterium zepuense TaxID=2593302 RepID=A0A552UWM0_9FLAO|nr:hypothetical protein [Flavobacterium zepuense]TRW22624.1 hypothetical protein FMM05_17245 [Flavobacterium zepuense]
MPVSFGMRNEENERINNVLKQLVALTFVPENWNEGNAATQLQKLGLSLEVLKTISIQELTDYLLMYHMDWANMELFADVVASLSTKAGLELLKEKAVGTYNFIQQESKMFSFEIMGKVNALNKI